MMLRQFYKRGLHLLAVSSQSQAQLLRQASVMSSIQMVNNISFIPFRQRSFAKKRRGRPRTDVSDQSEEEIAEEAAEVPVEEEVVEEVVEEAQPEPEQAAVPLDELNLKEDLFEAFSVDVKRIDSTDDHKPPINEDTIEGRFASVLFTAASLENSLFEVYEDMTYLVSLYKNCEDFELFTRNSGIGNREINAFNDALRSIGDFNDVTYKFIKVCSDCKRFMYINDIAKKYLKLYQLFNMEQKITIISAEDLNESQKSDVLAALQSNPRNEGMEFILEFQIDDTILGGLQMYTESEFMDMSLSSRVDKLANEMSKIVE